MHLNKQLSKGLCLLLLCLLGLLTCQPLFAKTIEYPAVRQGVLDLRSWDFEQAGAVSLNGEWEFYWRQFLQPDQLDSVPGPRSYLTVPASWTKKNSNGSILPGDGYATYHLTIKLNPEDQSLKALKMPPIYTAYQLWANGQVVAGKGRLGTSRAEMKPLSVPSIVFLQPKNGEIDLLIQVSNYYHIKGGLRKALHLGTPAQVMGMREAALNLQMVLLGSMLVIGLYYLVHYFFRRKEKNSLYFGLFCLVMGFRLLFIGEFAIYNLFPAFDWSLAKKMDYATLYSGIPLFGLFIYHLYPQYVSSRLLYSLVAISDILIAIVILAPTKLYLSTINFYQVLAGLTTVYYVFILFKAARDKQESAFLSALTAFIFLLTIFNDILSYNNIIDTYDNLFSIGFLAFLFSQSVILSKRFSLAFSQAESLSKENAVMLNEITDLNRNLEGRISQRTSQLNEIIEILNKEISERSEAEQKLRIYATTDIMTGLANRATGLSTLNSQLALAKRNNLPLTVGFVDIDNLKLINDDLGHQMGDDLIINISQILLKQIRQSDTVSRIGGDEFLIIFPDCKLQDARAVWQRVEEGIAAFNEANSKPYRISISFGFA